MQPQIKNHLIFFIDAPKIAYKNNEDIVHSRKKGGGGNLYHSFRKKKKKMRRKPELSDSTLRWKGTEPTASTVKKKKKQKTTYRKCPWNSNVDWKPHYHFTRFYTILASRFSTNIIWKKKIFTFCTPERNAPAHTSWPRDKLTAIHHGGGCNN